LYATFSYAEDNRLFDSFPIKPASLCGYRFYLFIFRTTFRVYHFSLFGLWLLLRHLIIIIYNKLRGVATCNKVSAFVLSDKDRSAAALVIYPLDNENDAGIEKVHHRRWSESNFFVRQPLLARIASARFHRFFPSACDAAELPFTYFTVAVLFFAALSSHLSSWVDIGSPLTLTSHIRKAENRIRPSFFAVRLRCTVHVITCTNSVTIANKRTRAQPHFRSLHKYAKNNENVIELQLFRHGVSIQHTACLFVGRVASV